MAADVFTSTLPPHPPAWIKQFRARLGLTQVKLASRLGVSFATVNRWENGQTVPSPLSWSQIFKLDNDRSVPSMSSRGGGGDQPSIALLTELDILYPKLSRFFPYVFGELRQFFKAAGYKTRLYTGERVPQEPAASFRGVYDELIADVAHGKICGVVAMYSHPNSWDWTQRLAAARVPVVGDIRMFPFSVMLPFREWVSIAIRHLVAQGRRRIAMVGWGADVVLADPFRDEMVKMGLSYHPEWARGDLHPNSRGAGWAELREVWTSHREKPDGLIITDDQFVPDACSAINDLGLRVPEQLSVVTHSNKGLPFHAPLPMTRLEYDPDAHVQAVGEMLLKLIRGEPVANPHADPDPAVAFRLLAEQVSIPAEESSRG